MRTPHGSNGSPVQRLERCCGPSLLRRVNDTGKLVRLWVPPEKEGQRLAYGPADDQALVKEQFRKVRDRHQPGAAAAMTEDVHPHLAAHWHKLGAGMENTRSGMNDFGHGRWSAAAGSAAPDDRWQHA
jgi:hypothetical protein